MDAGVSRLASSRIFPLVGALLFAGLLVLVYNFAYVINPSSPNSVLESGGWWHWWDQARYLKSAQALANGDFRLTEHWYPFGYALFATPFVFTSPLDPFYPVNLVSFLVLGLALVILGIRLGLGPWAGVFAFIVGVLPSDLFVQYVVPWSTTPVAALYVVALVIYVGAMNDRLTGARCAGLAAVVAIVAATRPTDAVALLPIFLHLALNEQGRWSQLGGPERRKLLRAVAGGVAIGSVIIGSYLLLHLAVYGFAASDYSRVAAGIGLDPSLIPIRYLLLFNSPQEIYGEGVGILEQYPALFFGIAGLAYSLMFSRYKAIPLVILSSLAVYLSFVDFLPTGLWRYGNVHYLKWMFPVLALLAVYSARELIAQHGWLRLVAALTVSAPLCLIGFDGKETYGIEVENLDAKEVLIKATNPAPQMAIRFSNVRSEFHSLYFEPHRLEIGGKQLSNTYDFKALLADGNAVVVLHKPRSFSEARFKVAPGVDVRLGGPIYLVEPVLTIRSPFRCDTLKVFGERFC